MSNLDNSARDAQFIVSPVLIFSVFHPFVVFIGRFSIVPGGTIAGVFAATVWQKSVPTIGGGQLGIGRLSHRSNVAIQFDHKIHGLEVSCICFYFDWERFI